MTGPCDYMSRLLGRALDACRGLSGLLLVLLITLPFHGGAVSAFQSTTKRSKMQSFSKAEERRGFRSLEAMVVGPEGSLGVMPYFDAKRVAGSMGLSLVEVSSSPLVWKIADYGKMMYELSKSAKSRKKPPQEHEIKFGLSVADADYSRSVSRVREFLEAGDTVKVTVFLRGFEMRMKDRAQSMMDRVLSDCRPQRVQGTRELQGRQFSLRISGAAPASSPLMVQEGGK